MIALFPLMLMAMEPTTETLTLTVDGVERKAIIVIPSSAKTKSSPIVFAFHGHGGNMNYSVRKFAVGDYWPEAIAVYPQGLPTAGRTDPDGKKNGWQNSPGLNGDRDLKFFDQLLVTAKKMAKVDSKRIYSVGHSNGAGFTYCLWRTRPNLLAAIAVCAGGFGSAPDPSPIPVLHIAGRKDPVVPFKNQERTIERLKTINQCSADGKPWDGRKDIMEFSSKVGAPVVAHIHNGSHEMPQDSNEVFYKFLKQHSKK